ncbi:toxin-antitoxin system YwqK family antitoxin [Ancylomarina longa]|uniref:Toxin-antitoxin system YwqK family antitoxin n=1 Tax=Ancylomarina longa TaxID=2487017 RepID=A0A434AGU3_9BACT|nr:hypothetical protein [Ancylomarina longa]RUT73549.1 hypothetical protein DLK05_12640 [Ancylomarina longa]
MNHKIFLFLLICMPFFSLAQSQNQTDDLGRKQGYWEKKSPKGKLIYAGTFQDNYPIGEMKRFHENGNLKAVLFFSNHGKFVRASLYNKSEELTAKGNYIESHKDSIWNYYDTKQRLRSSETYQLEVKNGWSQYFFTNGNASEKIEFKDGQKHGLWTKYFENGQIYLEAVYDQGKLNGGFQIHYPNGIIEYGGKYIQNKKEGKWDYYSDKGDILLSVEYKNGIASNQEELDSLQQEKLKKMESQKDLFMDPSDFLNDPDAYRQSQMRK